MRTQTGLSWCFPAIAGRRPADSLIPTLIKYALEGLQENGFNQAFASQLLIQFLEAESAITSHIEGLSELERDAIRTTFTTQGGLNLTGFPSISDVISPFPLPPSPLPPVRFPPFPPINIPID